MPKTEVKPNRPKRGDGDYSLLAREIMKSGKPRKITNLFRGEHKSLWVFPKHGVTSSLLGTYITCMEQTRLHYVEGWRSRTIPISLEFGTCMHWVLEQVYGRMMEPPSKKKIIKLVSQYEQEWLGLVESPSRKQLEQQEMVYGLAEKVLPYYFQRWDGDFNGGKYKYGSDAAKPHDWESLEEIFDVPYEYEDGLIVPRRGRRDGVFRDKKGRLWVFDTKCLSMISDNDIMDTLNWNFQQMFYLSVTAKQMGEYPAGCILNVIRRPGQRWLTDDTLPIFLERVEKDVSNPRRFDHYFIRYELRVTPREIREWERRQLDPIMKSIRGWWEGHTPHFVNPNSLITKYGRCQMFLPIVKQEFTNCYKADIPFAELAEIGA